MNMTNPADICRECEVQRQYSELSIEVVALMEENRVLKKAGHRLALRLAEVVNDDKFRREEAIEAIDEWIKAREVAE